MVQKLFVYGTLKPGQPNEHILKPIDGSWEIAFVNGELLQIGWGAAMGYPGITLDKNAALVEGLLFTSDKLKENWTMLDEFEGEGYKRVLTKVQIKNNMTVDAYIYVVNDHGPNLSIK